MESEANQQLNKFLFKKEKEKEKKIEKPPSNIQMLKIAQTIIKI